MKQLLLLLLLLTMMMMMKLKELFVVLLAAARLEGSTQRSLTLQLDIDRQTDRETTRFEPETL